MHLPYMMVHGAYYKDIPGVKMIFLIEDIIIGDTLLNQEDFT